MWGGGARGILGGQTVSVQFAVTRGGSKIKSMVNTEQDSCKNKADIAIISAVHSG